MLGGVTLQPLDVPPAMPAAGRLLVAAPVLSDPNFAAKQQSELDKLNAFYDETYGLFSQGEHALVLDRLRGIEDRYGVNNVLMPKFDLLKAMSLGAFEYLVKPVNADALEAALRRALAAKGHKRP